MKKAYSYIRFSSAVQLKGDSLRRQLEASRAYAKQHNLELDESLQDIGVSAYTGENATEGALKKFIELVKSKQVEKGSILIIESLDRLSRQAVLKTLSLFTDILSSGVEIVTLTDGQHYTDKSINDIGQLMFSLMTMSRSHQESEIKSIRGKAAWDNKRKLALEQKKPMTRKCPNWLIVNDEMSGFILIEERAEIIKKIFELSIDGIGQRKIAKTFNEDGIQPFTSGNIWHATYIRDLIKNRALLGEYQPKHKGEPIGKPIQDYYPRVMDEGTFYRAQAETKKRLSGSSGRKGKTFSNLFTGMCKCTNCGDTYRYISSLWTPQLMCNKNYMGADCNNATRYDYKTFEIAALVELSKKSNWFEPLSDNKDKTKIEGTIAACEAKLSEINQSVSRYAELFTSVDNDLLPDAKERYVKALKQQKSTNEEIESLKTRLGNFGAKEEAIRNISESFRKLRDYEGQQLYLIRTKINKWARDNDLRFTFGCDDIKMIIGDQEFSLVRKESEGLSRTIMTNIFEGISSQRFSSEEESAARLEKVKARALAMKERGEGLDLWFNPEEDDENEWKHWT
ncbi:Site-specific DNA recombinase [Mariprofundus aestuarium]|uniref:Site-specific DNA recombinase n=1 Tax=Mariprofundus aestuarium TaxID=1921086 RepID=A0A2K8L0S0_MARES|nr:recombinase family protein [Mariprofundus aestuarium]ATX80662.1 Site-specific DNA recombinase [Mariprofundus aestuarium]